MGGTTTPTPFICMKKLSLKASKFHFSPSWMTDLITGSSLVVELWIDRGLPCLRSPLNVLDSP